MKIYLGLGTNVGDRERNLSEALYLLDQHKQIQIKKRSSIFESEPVGYTNQFWFFNAAVEIDTNLHPHNLLDIAQGIEKQLGRKKTFRWGPRIIDIDILSFGGVICKDNFLTLPHPEMHLRKFVLLPLAEIAPHYVHPLFNLTIQQLIDHCPDNQVHLYSTFKNFEIYN